jgi:hypothetical protein
VEGFTVASFWSALGGSLVVSLTNWLVSAFTKEPGAGAARSSRGGRGKRDDVIDI